MTLNKISDTSVPYPQWSIEELSDFVVFIEQHCKQEESLFRGQASDWLLRPKLARLHVPDGRSLLGIEQEMLDHFERAVVAYMSVPPVSRWELCALAQHHGMATRLLDWTYNPLAALWFALDKPAVAPVANAVVWMFCPSESDIVSNVDSSPTSVSAVCYWKPLHISPRIRAQGGVFTVHPFVSGTLQPLQEAKDHHPKLTKILIPRSSFSNIRYQLDRCGVNAAVIYPDLDGLARHIEWLYSYAEDELDATLPDHAEIGGKRGGYRGARPEDEGG